MRANSASATNSSPSGHVRLEQPEAGEEQVAGHGDPSLGAEPEDGDDVEHQEGDHEPAPDAASPADGGRQRAERATRSPPPVERERGHDAHPEQGEPDGDPFVPATLVGEQDDGQPGHDDGDGPGDFGRTATGGRSRVTCGRRSTFARNATSLVHERSMLRITARRRGRGGGTACPTRRA